MATALWVAASPALSLATVHIASYAQVQVADTFNKLQTMGMHMAMLLLYDVNFRCFCCCRTGSFPFHASTEQVCCAAEG